MYAEARHGPAGRSYQLVAVEPTPYLLQTLDRSRDGARLGSLAAALVEADITRAEADAYIAELVDSQVLVADIEPQLTGAPPAQAMVATLRRGEHGAGLAQRLDAANTSLAAIDTDGIGVPADRYRAAAAVLDGLPVSPEPSRFAQVDLIKPADEVTLSSDVVSELERGVEVLHAFTSYRQDERLLRFREQFTHRFQTREVPLTQALDEENGIGFGRLAAAATGEAPHFGGLHAHANDQPAQWSGRDTLLLDKLTRALATGESEIAVTAAEAAAVRATEPPPLPDAFEVVATVVADGRQPARSGDFQVLLQSASGPPGARLLGRFCHADQQLLQSVRSHLAAEESARPDAVFAEVVHLPEGRAGNILARPALRGYEIPYLGRSGAPADRQLPLSDLLVSVQGERIVLRSRRLGCEVFPRLTAAHNHSLASLGVYRFLCALQHQQVAFAVTWDWGPLASAPFLPRVVSGRVVLSRARWNLGDSELAAFREPQGARQYAAIQRLREQRRMPRYVALADGENTLMADMDNVLSLEALAHEVKRRSSASLVELPSGPDELCASGPEGPFTHEIVVPFARPAPQPAPMSPGRSIPASSPRSFPPGSQWLYVKLYSGTATADTVLEQAVYPVVASLADSGADRWFFIRYADPDPHLRLRIHGAPDRLLHETQPLLHRVTAPLLETGQLWRVQLDTYEREVERYGGDDGIRLAEQAFHADSAAVLGIVAQLAGDAGADLRWRTAVRGIDLLFDDLGLALDQKRAIARSARDGYGQEFGAGAEFRREAGRWFRDERPFLEAILDPQRDPPPEVAGAIQALHQRSTALAPVARELRDLAGAGRLSAGIPDLAMSLAHMHVNRMLRSAHRAQELVLYELLDRAYSSQAARRPR
jgi:thiopeptide-type bacteriocin biosynthesis protein